MKKLTTLIVLVFLAVGLFASPIEIPEYIVPYEEVIPYKYVSNNCQNIYEIYTTKNKSNDHFQLNFFNRSLILPTSIFLEIEFTSKKKYDDFIKDIDLIDIEKSFDTARQKLIKQGITPDIFKYNNGKTTMLTRENNNTKYGYGYDVDFDFQTLPSSIIYKAKF